MENKAQVSFEYLTILAFLCILAVLFILAASSLLPARDGMKNTNHAYVDGALQMVSP